MKKSLFIILSLFLFSNLAMAQPGAKPQVKQERVEAYKIAFFTEKLQLTPDESRDFWPLYNQYEKEQENLRERYDLRGKKLELMSDAEVEDFVMGQVQMAEDLAKMRRDYVMRFKEILPIRKVALLQHINREFKKELLDEIRKRREQRQGGTMRKRPGGR